MMLFERVCDHLNEGNFESRVVSAVINLNLALKAFGPQADVLYKEQVDKLQVRTWNSVTIFFHRNKLIRFILNRSIMSTKYEHEPNKKLLFKC